MYRRLVFRASQRVSGLHTAAVATVIKQPTSNLKRATQLMFAFAGLATGSSFFAHKETSPTLCDNRGVHGWNRKPLPKKSIIAIATLINAAVDIPDMNEAEEQEIIQSAVERIIYEMEAFMPETYWKRIMTSKMVPETQRDLMQERLTDHFQRTLHFPYLTDEDQNLIVHATVAIITDAMGDTKLDDILTQQDTSISLVGIFIRAALGISNVEELRKSVTELVELPLPLPESLVKWAIGKGVTMLVAVVDNAVNKSLTDCFSQSATLKISTTEEFHKVLHDNVVDLLYTKFDLLLLPGFLQEFYISKIVETYFALSVDKPRMDSAVRLLLNKQTRVPK